MSTRFRPRRLALPALAMGLVLPSVMFLLLGSVTAGAGLAPHPASTLVGSSFVSAPPSGAKGPDDLTELAVPGVDHGRPIVWVAYQNGINPNGTPGVPGGTTQSRVVGYDERTGALVRSINVTGKVDGLTADRGMGTLIATVNEDDNSGFNLLYPATGAVATYSYRPNPAVSGNGGTDSIAVLHGKIYVAHSNPNDTRQATDYLVTLHRANLSAQLTPVFFDDSNASVIGSGAVIALALTDPDTNYAMPSVSHRYAGELATISQGDGKIIFATPGLSNLHLRVLNLTDNVSGNVPPADGFAVSTCGTGTLFVVDAGAGAIYAFHVASASAGTAFIGEPNDNGNPLVGTLNLYTGVITPFTNHFVSPKGLLFVPGSGC